MELLTLWSPLCVVLLAVLVAILAAKLTAVKASLNTTITHSEKASKHGEELQLQVDELKGQNVRLETQLENNKQLLNDRDKIEQLFKDKFESLSASALKSQSTDFSDRYDRLFKSGREAIDKMIAPLQQKIEQLDTKGEKQSVSFKEQMEKMIEQTLQIGNRAQGLEKALRKPNIRGAWAEHHLKNALKTAELREGIDFTTQDVFVTNGENGEKTQKRTDFIVNLPEGHSLILDSKTSLEALIDLGHTEDEEQKKQLLNKHLEQVKQHVKDLSSKEYWRSLDSTPDYAVMVLQEPDFYYAVERDVGLTDWALEKKVIIVTPPALSALLRALALTWKQVRVVEKANEIAKLGKDLHNRLSKFAEYYLKVGEALQRAVKNYNDANRSWDRNLMSQVRKFQELELNGDKKIDNTDDIVSPNTITKIPETPKNPAST